ncbi:hypothetical protein BXZ70DRAFT_739117 [Cristinia sonorae]|uniref:YCII-related domain-containing protein n=1 Tax=Cristinia sonorae TaxID=1940300 RepID=A0A8K0UUI3_9AGAR|nr:hypothetical protein BXZ70DRAFT_739117 [Cristinia sonorae]
MFALRINSRRCISPLKHTTSQLSTRTMSTAPAKHQFIVWAPDYTDPEAFDRRLAVRAAHLQNAFELIKNGVIKTGGAMMSPDTYLTENKKFVGSAMIVEAESIEAVRKQVESDIYWSSNVWDKEKLTILPFFAPPPPKA